MPVPPEIAATDSSGIGFIRPLEATARKLGIPILLQHRMAGLVRENSTSGRVLGIAVTNQNRTLHFRARKGVIIGTGGHTSNVNFRRIFDPRLTEEYQVAGEPYSFQDASGELAAMAVGASLWGAFNQTGEFGQAVTKAGYIGCQYGYTNLTWASNAASISQSARQGLRVADYQDVILVNQMGLRFYDETQGQFTDNNYNSINPDTPYSYLNAANIRWNPRNFLNAAHGRQPRRQQRRRPHLGHLRCRRREAREVDRHAALGGYRRRILRLAATRSPSLAANIRNQYQKKPMPAAALAANRRALQLLRGWRQGRGFRQSHAEVQDRDAAVLRRLGHAGAARYALGPAHQRASAEVVDLDGKVIPGLYCGGESAGGFSLHGLARCCVQGRIAGREAARG